MNTRTHRGKLKENMILLCEFEFVSLQYYFMRIVWTTNEDFHQAFENMRLKNRGQNKKHRKGIYAFQMSYNVIIYYIIYWLVISAYF